MKGNCDKKGGAIRALKVVAERTLKCEISDKENIPSNYHPLNNNITSTSSLDLEGWYDDDSSGSDYSCGSQCSWDDMYDCFEDCDATIADCSDYYDIVSIPSCIEAAAGCFQALEGECCSCGCYYEVYDCSYC